MVAAPLIALGLTHPEGHDLLGKAEQSVMLLLGVFLKPVLLITGLLSGIILTFVAANLLDAGFFRLMYAQLTNHDNVTGGTQFVVIIGMLIFYTMAMMAIVDQCFSLIYVLSDKTLRWIGGHPEQSAEGGMLQQVKSGYEGKIGEGAQAGGQQVSAIKGSGITAQAPPPMAKKEKGGSDMETKGGGGSDAGDASSDNTDDGDDGSHSSGGGGGSGGGSGGKPSGPPKKGGQSGRNRAGNIASMAGGVASVVSEGAGLAAEFLK
jgi:defect-in-organelle-trafficking protein DotA